MTVRAATSPLSLDNSDRFPEKRLALVVGVDHAPASDKGPLDNAVRDASDMAAALQDYCGFELINGTPVFDAQATSTFVGDSIRALARERSDNDFLLFYFAGHAAAITLPNGKDEIYLVTSDYKRIDVQEDEHRHISFKWLWDYLYEGNHAGKVVIILDCCYSGNFSSYGQDLNMHDIVQRLSFYFDNLNFRPDAKMDGLRLTLAATSYNRTTGDRSQRLTEFIIPALNGTTSGAIDARGEVTLYSLREYLRSQKRSANLSGSDAGRECVLARHSKLPQSYFPYPYEHDNAFIPRQDEFETLDAVLLGNSPVRLGLTGLGGVGKSQLARELVCRHADYFTDGIFWASASGKEISSRSTGQNPLIGPLARLAADARYLPPDEDYSRPDDELRARYLCSFLASRPRTLLILDDLDDPGWLLNELPRLAGSALQCAVLFTTRPHILLSGVRLHRVLPLQKEDDLLSLLLYEVPSKQDVLTQALAGQVNAETQAARSMCRRVGGLPLALILLQRRLLENDWLTLVEMDQEMAQRGVMAVADSEETILATLQHVFATCWQRINSPVADLLFKLASFFTAATPMPLWLLALAADLEEKYVPGAPFADARNLLARWNFVENVSRDTIQVHSLLREFGQSLVLQDNNGPHLLQSPTRRVVTAFADIPQLERRAIDNGFWDCLDQLKLARSYVDSLASIAPHHAGTDLSRPSSSTNGPTDTMNQSLQSVERRLDQETFFLAASNLWPDRLPGLFYQQMYNRILEEKESLPSVLPADKKWLRQLTRVGIAEKALLKVFAGHSAGVTSVAFSPDGTCVLTGSEDATARLFDAATGRLQLVLKGHSQVIDSVAFAPNGSTVLTGSRDYTACLWHATTGELLYTFTGHKNWVSCVAFSPDNTRILTSSLDGSVRLWNLADGALLSTFSYIEEDKNKPLSMPSLWDEPGDEEDDDDQDTLDSHAITCAVFSPDGTHILIGFLNGSVWLCNATDGTLIEEYTAYGRWIMSLAFSSDGCHFLSASVDRTIDLWDIADSSGVIAVLSAHTGPVASVTFSPDGAYILSGSWDRTFRLWQATNGKLLYTSDVQASGSYSVAFSPNSSTILVGFADGTARLWEMTAIQTEHISSVEDEDLEDIGEEELPFFMNDALVHQRAHLTQVAFSSDGTKLLVGYCDHTASLWDVQTGRIAEEWLDNDGEVLSVALSPDDTRMVLGVDNNIASVWDISGDKRLDLKGHTGFIYTVAFSPDGHHILTASADRTARLWNAATGKTILTLRGHFDSVCSVAFAPDGRYMLTGSRDRTARLWKRVGRTYLPLILSGHGGDVISVAFSSDNRLAFTGSMDTHLRVWEVATGQLLASLDGQFEPIRLISCSPNSKYVLTAGLYDQVRLWDISAQGSFRLVGAYATNKTVKALHWLDSQHFLLADDIGPMHCPRVYRLRLEGFEE